MDYKIYPVRSEKDLEDFTMLPFDLYDKNSPWVAPLIGQYKKYISGEDNLLNYAGPHEKILLRDGKRTIGRLIVGINEELNKYHGLKEAYISQFESIEDIEAARLLLGFAENWAKKRGMTLIKGPLSLPGGDDNRGFLIDNFQAPVYVMNTYNKPYYNDFFLDFGFVKYFDCYGYEADLVEEALDRYKKAIPRLMKRFNYRLDKVNLKDKKALAKDADDIKRIIEEAMPKDWLDFMPPSQEEIEGIVKQLVPFADGDLIFIARSTIDNRPLGFNITLPDYNQVLKDMKGRLLPTGFVSFLLKKRKINRGRMLVLFVIPSYRNKGVSGAIYLASQEEAQKKGYTRVEGSTIWEYNKEMLADIESFGAERTKVYRIYTKDIL